MVLRPEIVIVGVPEVRKTLRDIGDKDAAFVNVVALTKTGQDIKAAEYQEMQSVFDRPTRFALNSLQLRPATKADPVAEVGYRQWAAKGTPAERYLGPNVEGGKRGHKRFEKALIAKGMMASDEYAVPGAGAPLDGSGNMRGGYITRMLSQLGASERTAGYKQNMTARSQKRNIKRAKGRFFVMRDADGRVADGIYQQANDRAIIPILLFVKAPSYEKRFPFYQLGRSTFEARYPVHAKEQWLRILQKRKKYRAPF